jgi:uncharacterized coiled-coil DUF342 family protein
MYLPAKYLNKHNSFLEKSAMKANKKNVAFLILFPISFGQIFLLTGCTMSRQPIEASLPPGSEQTAVGKRFQESARPGPTAVESAIELSKKYAKLSEETMLLRQKRQEFIAENRRLKDRVAVLQTQLQQAEKELTEANDLLIDMRVELNNWKANVLSFRDEMRDAEKAQLDALLKILKVLGGEVREEPAQEKNTGLTKVSQSKPAQAPLKTPISGETNE